MPTAVPTRTVAGVSCASGGVRYTREYFATAPDNVIAARLTADRPGRIGFTTSVRTRSNRTATITSRAGHITLTDVSTTTGCGSRRRSR